METVLPKMRFRKWRLSNKRDVGSEFNTNFFRYDTGGKNRSLVFFALQKILSVVMQGIQLFGWNAKVLVSSVQS
jgi:hypothetical protein